MKHPLTSLLLLFACAAFAEKSDLAVLLEKASSGTEREVRHVRFTCDFSDDFEDAENEPFDVCGISAGLGVDFVPGRMTGVQWGAGVAVSASSTGVQGSFGLAIAEEFTGIQMGLIAPMSNDGTGIQIGGVCCFIRGDRDREGAALSAFHGIQIGGLANCASGNGVQLSLLLNETAGYFNYADELRNRGWESRWRGVQGSVIANRACYLEGVQFAFLFNYAVRCRGVQIGALNRADELQGVQFGLINVADSGAGLQIGLINSFGSDGERLILPFLNARF